MQKSRNPRIWLGKTTILLMWILLAFQAPYLIAHQSKLIEVFGQYSFYYFVILLGYLFILILISVVGVWFIRQSRSEIYTHRIDSFVSKRKTPIFIGIISVWLIWIIVNQYIYFPEKVTLGINSALMVFSFSMLLQYTPLVQPVEGTQFLGSLNASFLLFQILIPLGIFCLYSLFLTLFLPDGVNNAFMKRSASLFLPITIFMFIAFFISITLFKTKLKFHNLSIERLFFNDLVLLLLPLTPIVQYMINNTEILVWYENAFIFCLFLVLASIPILIIPQLFNKTDSIRPLLFLGLALTFMITYMALLTTEYKWYQEGDYKIQLLIFSGIWLVSWILFRSRLRGLLYIIILVLFLSNSIVQLIDLSKTRIPPNQDPAESMLVTLIDKREPIITPDIYLLVYESYVINQTMLAHGIDNLEQENYLKDLGFKIYPKTYSVDTTSIASMSRVFNASLDYYGISRKGVSGDGIVHNLLEDYGYKTYGIFPSDYFFSGITTSYDYWFPGPNSAVIPLTRAILMGELRYDIDFDELPRNEYIFEKRMILSNGSDELRFLYTHSDMPGHSINSGRCRPDEVEIYKKQVEIANIEMKEDLALVLDNNPEAIVIIAGDHGPYLTKNCTNTGDEYDISEIDRLDIQNRNGMFLAIRWPSVDFEDYDEITILQDIFPAIFAYMFKDSNLLQSKIEPTTINRLNISGVEVSDGIIIGGVHDGEPLFP